MRSVKYLLMCILDFADSCGMATTDKCNRVVSDGADAFNYTSLLEVNIVFLDRAKSKCIYIHLMKWSLVFTYSSVSFSNHKSRNRSVYFLDRSFSKNFYILHNILQNLDIVSACCCTLFYNFMPFALKSR